MSELAESRADIRGPTDLEPLNPAFISQHESSPELGGMTDAEEVGMGKTIVCGGGSGARSIRAKIASQIAILSSGGRRVSRETSMEFMRSVSASKTRKLVDRSQVE